MDIRYSNEDRVFNVNTEAIPYLSFHMLDAMGVPNLYSTRYISYVEKNSEGEKGLRLALMKDDNYDEAVSVIRPTRDALARQLGSSLEHECITDQKHTNNVIVAKKDDIGFMSSTNKPLHRQYVDGIITDIPDVLLTAFGGDCPPVYIVDPVRKAIGLVHAGWRGTLGRIPEVAIANMVVHFDSEPQDLYAAIGPGICQDCYEMGDEVYEIFAEQWGEGDADKILKRHPSDGRYHLDLRLANKLTLLKAGISEDHIAISNVCTMCNVDTFYSYRARKMENEQVAMLVNRFDIR